MGDPLCAGASIPLVTAPKDQRKEEVVAPSYRRLTGEDGVACILTSVEQGRTFVSYTPRSAPPRGDAHYRLLNDN